MTAFAAARLVVSDDGETAANAFRKRVADWRSSKENAGNQYGPIGSAAIWTQLESDGWLSAGFAVGADGGSLTPLRDLVELAEIWGGALLALPITATILVRRWTRGAPPLPEGPAEPLTFAVPAGGRALVPFGDSATAIAVDATGSARRLGKLASSSPAADGFATTLPLPACQIGTTVALTPAHAKEAAILHAATAIGCAAVCLQRTADYSRERIVYAKPIGTYQAVRHIIVDMYRDVELARSGIVGAVLEDDWRGLTEACLDMAQRVVARSIQVHGGVGFTWDMGLHFHARHILAVRSLVRALGATAIRAE